MGYTHKKIITDLKKMCKSQNYEHNFLNIFQLK